MWILYGDRNCVHCRTISNMLQMKNIPFQYQDVGDEFETPQLDAETGVMIVGFRACLNFIRGR